MTNIQRAVIDQVIKILRAAGIDAQLARMFGDEMTRIVITLPGVMPDDQD